MRAWQTHLATDGKAPGKGYAPATVNNHLAALGGFCSWVTVQAPELFVVGNPTQGVKALGVPALEPRRLNDEQIRSLRSVCDRLEHLYRAQRQPKGRDGLPPLHARARPRRDRAIVHVLLSTGLRRAELVGLDLGLATPERSTLEACHVVTGASRTCCRFRETRQRSNLSTALSKPT